MEYIISCRKTFILCSKSHPTYNGLIWLLHKARPSAVWPLLEGTLFPYRFYCVDNINTHICAHSCMCTGKFPKVQNSSQSLLLLSYPSPVCLLSLLPVKAQRRYQGLCQDQLSDIPVVDCVFSLYTVTYILVCHWDRVQLLLNALVEFSMEEKNPMFSFVKWNSFFNRNNSLLCSRNMCLLFTI